MTAPRSTLWTDEEDAELLRLRKRGLMRQQIADRLGRSKESVKSRIGRLRAAEKIPPKPKPKRPKKVAAKPVVEPAPTPKPRPKPEPPPNPPQRRKFTACVDEVHDLITRKKLDQLTPWENWYLAMHSINEETKAA